MTPTPLEDAQREHFQAKRRLRRLNDQARTEHGSWMLRERGVALDRVYRTLATLNRLEDEAGIVPTDVDDPERNPSPLEATDATRPVEPESTMHTRPQPPQA